ncbi:MAG: ribosomal protein S18-alanine N-acetyltransferase [Candidatus Cloacimonetes bacterium]|jgi:ribosomal-protein-alanine N-acetyltransferase|nr:ribosomal protein S18-alanine N-acetyltransferase [Candidatus Cloacimonadota bacterium]MDD3235668.1 ribosomal protein S18-alanine N-acetyltransferase [Candidatus Cloacimonadota bacterium]
MEPRLRATCEDDFEAFYVIEQKAFPHPWPMDAFTDFLLPWSWTLLYNDQIVGYIFYHGVEDEMVIINFAVDPQYHGRGWGEFLLKESLQIMHDNGVSRFFLDVRPSNQAARGLYEKYGFTSIAIRKNYYDHPEEDAIVMGKIYT